MPEEAPVLRNITVREYMSPAPITVAPDTDIQEAIRLLLEHRISGMPVVDAHGNLVGMLSERDCMKVALDAAYHESAAGKVRDFMSPEVETVYLDDTVVELAERFYTKPFRRYPVIDEENRLVGIIARRDVLRALQRLW
ncbi:MAG: hypothetical protein KatS3mg121_0778 [Gammaproteobacteria bacterium]|nr:MAG: hypothetical protein KatS3mg121_0778 [Gammaproteobacteria bacterium]